MLVWHLVYKFRTSMQKFQLKISLWSYTCVNFFSVFASLLYSSMRRWCWSAFLDMIQTTRSISETNWTRPTFARKYHATIRPTLSTRSSITYTTLFLFLFFSQLRLHTWQQDRVPRVTEFDGGGVPGAPNYQLGRDPLGQKTLRAVGGSSNPCDGIINRSLAARLPRLQGTLSFTLSFSYK